MVEVKSERIKTKIAILPDRIQKEWQSVCKYYSSKTDIEVFDEFMKSWCDFRSPIVDEFLNVSNTVYIEWEHWKCNHYYDVNFQEKLITEVWKEFKEFWQFDLAESIIMFKEMELLSEKMLREWRHKYNFTYPHVYESVNDYGMIQRGYRLKNKAQLWQEFKEIWEIDVSDYNEDKINEMSSYISDIICDDSEYSDEYPRNFWEFCENSNYHSFSSYSIIQKFEICEQWERWCYSH
jgi:hypothetical protein